MEASLASLSIKEGSTTTLTSLPPELLTSIAAHLPLGSLARFSLILRFVRDAIQPQLYRKVRLWSREDSKPKEAQCQVVKSVLKSLATDPKRCELIRELDLREWRWMGEGEMGYLENVLRCARRLKALQLMNFSTGDNPYISFFPKVWDLVLSLPELEALGCCAGPVVPLQLHRLKSLRRFLLIDYIIYPHEDGTLPSSLTELMLEAVTGFTATWFPPKMLGCLETLVLSWLDEESTKTVTSIIQAWEGKSTLRTLVVDLHVNKPPPSNSTTVALLTAALKLDSPTTFELHSTPWHSQTPNKAFAALEKLLPLAIRLEHLVLAMAASRPAMVTPTDLARLGLMLEQLPHLVSFKTDLATVYFDFDSIPQLISYMRFIGAPTLTRQTERLSVEQEATLLFGGHPSLKQVMLLAQAANEEEELVVFERHAAEEGVEKVGFAKWWREKDVRMVIDQDTPFA